VSNASSRWVAACLVRSSRTIRAVTCRLPIDTCTALEWSARSITILPHAVRSSPASQASPIDAREKRAGRSVDELAALGQPRAPRRWRSLCSSSSCRIRGGQISRSDVMEYRPPTDHSGLIQTSLITVSPLTSKSVDETGTESAKVTVCHEHTEGEGGMELCKR
jgi:hypothetical protein